MWAMALLFLPGTLVHELAHLIVARLLLVRAGKLSLFPQKIDSGRVKMGSVQFPPTDPVRRFLIGIAPVYVGIGLILAILWWAETNQVWQSWIWLTVIGYVIFQLANSMFASSKDMEGALGLFIFLALLAGLLYWSGWRPDFEWVGPWLSQYEQVLTQTSRWLMVPIIIDVVVLAVLWMMSRLFRLRAA